MQGYRCVWQHSCPGMYRPILTHCLGNIVKKYTIFLGVIVLGYAAFCIYKSANAKMKNDSSLKAMKQLEFQNSEIEMRNNKFDFKPHSQVNYTPFCLSECDDNLNVLVTSNLNLSFDEKCKAFFNSLKLKMDFDKFNCSFDSFMLFFSELLAKSNKFESDQEKMQFGRYFIENLKKMKKITFLEKWKNLFENESSRKRLIKKFNHKDFLFLVKLYGLIVEKVASPSPF